MASWLKNGRSSLFEAFNKVCDQIDQDIRADLLDAESTKQLPNHQAIVNELTDHNEKLKKKNDALEKEVERLHRIASIPADRLAIEQLPPGSSMADDVLEPSDNEYVLIRKYSNLAHRFKVLNENFRKARAILERRRAERDAWKKRCETLYELLQEDSLEHGVQTSSRASAALASLQPIAALNNSFSSNADPSEETSICPKQDEQELPANNPYSDTPSAESILNALGPTDSTQGESETSDLPAHLVCTSTPSDLPVKREFSSDGPVVISARPVKKKKAAEAGKIIFTPGMRIKEESQNANLYAENSRPAASQESIDLGNVTHMMTPRKPREEVGFSPAFRAANGKYFANSISQAETVTPIAKFVKRSMPVPENATASVMSSALTPISVNRKISQSGKGKLSRKRILESGIADIAEDGLDSSTDQECTPIWMIQNCKKTPKNRVEQLLHQPEADHSAELTRSLRTRESGIATSELSVPERRELPFDKSSRQRRPRLSASVSAQPRSRSPQRPSERQTKPSGGRLRDKPVRELSLEDFRINPNSNEGHDFAFLDVVRDRDDRACLPGCTEMHCCGKQFRALAISQRPNPPLTPEQRLEEQRLLEQFLGDYSYRLATMEAEERTETWIQAKTQELANKYGKHRHRFPRMQSPPGFWNADFPSTQELELNREEANKREAKAIQERYREAMRPGGRWIFKDE